jgi:REP element-mobilizing transposase RayT
MIPAKYSLSSVVGKMKANISRQIRIEFPWTKKMYWRNEFWSPGLFSSTVGINEEVIKRCVGFQFQEKVDAGKCSWILGFDLGFASQVPRA